MKIQNLAVIFIIIILPLSIVLSLYLKNRVETISMQSNYDSKLNDATHDAVKAYQINSFSNDTYFYANSKMRDIEAAVNTFFTSLSTNFNTLGYTKETLQNYVPAIVFAMYDGYYIYSPFNNTWSINSSNDGIKEEMNEQIKADEQHKFQNSQIIFDLKPYVFYSCRYRINNDNDVTITYSLDNYVQIQGKADGNVISWYGYLYSNSNLVKNGGSYTYKGCAITNETALSENIYADGSLKQNLPYIKENGTKYYKYNDKAYYVLNGKFHEQNGFDMDRFNNDDRAVNHYKEAYELRDKIKGSNFLSNLSTDDIVDIDTGNKYTAGKSPYYSVGGKIFNFDSIEDETSNFNTHRIDVIKNSIVRNLSSAIANFNAYSGVETDFQMPKLLDTDWDKIMNNISVISFLQGMNIGGKIYNGYSIVTNTMNEDVVMEDSIYIKTGDGKIHDITENGLNVNGNTVGVFNINTEPRKSSTNEYYIPVNGTLSYDSIITKNNIAYDKKIDNTLSNYIDTKVNSNLKKIYYTALARERYSLYRPELSIGN